MTEKVIGKDNKKQTKMRFRYDAEHQMQTAEIYKNGVEQTVHYRYDPFGRRISKTDSFNTTHFIWDGNRLLTEIRGNQSTSFIYEQDGFVPVAQVDQDNQIHHYHTDHLGTPRELTNPEGEITWQAVYKTWGNTITVSYEALEPEEAPVVQPLRFQGQYFDVETGLHYNRFRYYDPDVGRFISQDPIGLLGGDNLYQYSPNPTGWIDPLGLAKKNNNEFFVRVMSKEEADNSTCGLSLKPGHSGAKWVSKGKKAQDSLKKKGHEKTVLMEVEPGTTKWLEENSIDYDSQDGGEASCPNKVFTKKNEKGALGIGKNLLSEFNSKIKKVVIK